MFFKLYEEWLQSEVSHDYIENIEGKELRISFEKIEKNKEEYLMGFDLNGSYNKQSNQILTKVTLLRLVMNKTREFINKYKPDIIMFNAEDKDPSIQKKKTIAFTKFFSMIKGYRIGKVDNEFYNVIQIQKI